MEGKIKFSNESSQSRDQVHMPANSVLYERVVPALLLILALVTAVILLVVLGVLLGLVPYR